MAVQGPKWPGHVLGVRPQQVARSEKGATIIEFCSTSKYANLAYHQQSSYEGWISDVLQVRIETGSRKLECLDIVLGTSEETTFMDDLVFLSASMVTSRHSSFLVLESRGRCSFMDDLAVFPATHRAENVDQFSWLLGSLTHFGLQSF